MNFVQFALAIGHTEDGEVSVSMRITSLTFEWAVVRSGGGNTRKARQGLQNSKGAVPAYKIPILGTFGHAQEGQIFVPIWENRDH